MIICKKHNRKMIPYVNKMDNICGCYCPQCEAEDMEEARRLFPKIDHSNKKKYTKICEHCGVSFESNYLSSRYCGKECKQEVIKINGKIANARRKNIKLDSNGNVIRFCKRCGQRITNMILKKYCSDCSAYLKKNSGLKDCIWKLKKENN